MSQIPRRTGHVHGLCLPQSSLEAGQRANTASNVCHKLGEELRTVNKGMLGQFDGVADAVENGTQGQNNETQVMWETLRLSWRESWPGPLAPFQGLHAVLCSLSTPFRPWKLLMVPLSSMLAGFGLTSRGKSTQGLLC